MRYYLRVKRLSVAAVAATLVACKSPSPWARLRADIEQQVRLAGTDVSVVCQGEQQPVCKLIALDQSQVTLLMTLENGAWNWRLPDRTIDARTLAAYVSSQYKLMYPRTGLAKFACGPALQQVNEDPIVCSADPEHQALATLDDDNNLQIEILINSVSIKARTAASDEALLLQTSLQLDQRQSDDDDASLQDADNPN
jgi:hypothetical protein